MPVYTDINQEKPESNILVEDLESIYQSLENLLSTNIGERFFNPEYGADLDSYLFELMTEDTALKIFTSILESVSRWEPRIVLLIGQCSVDPIYEKNVYNITLVFKIIGLEDQKFEFNRILSK